MKKIMIYISLALLALIVIAIAIWGLRVLFDLKNPLRQEPEQIKESILEQTPIGMSMDEAVEVLEAFSVDKNWIKMKVNNDRGFYRPGTVSTSMPVGKKSIEATIGKYRNFFETYIYVWWAFDENSELIEVFVRKGTVGF